MRVVAILMSLLMFSSVCSAGGWAPAEKKVKTVKVPVTVSNPSKGGADKVVPEAQDILPEQPIVIVKKYEPIKVVPVSGSGFGFYQDIPTILWANDYLPIEIGCRATRKDGGSIDLRGVLRYTRPALNLEGGYFVLHYGVSAFLDSPELAPVGLFVGCETYLLPSVSITADIYPLRIGREIRTGEVMVGGRIYL